MRNIVIIGAASGYGASNPACQDGPEGLRSFDFLEQLEESGIIYRWNGILHHEEGEDRLPAIAKTCSRLADRTEAAIRGGDFPIVVGGDHSCAIGTWAGVRRTTERLGLVWIDAHMDSHTFETSPSLAIHGMPLACLLGYGSAALTKIPPSGAKLRPEDVCLIGTRSYEKEEKELLDTLCVRICFMEEIRKRGLGACISEAISIVTKHTTGFGISIDLDAFDPMEEPGVGSPVPDGIFRNEIAEAFAGIAERKDFLALEIVEYNPYLDRKFATAHAISDLIEAIAP